MRLISERDLLRETQSFILSVLHLNFLLASTPLKPFKPGEDTNLNLAHEKPQNCGDAFHRRLCINLNITSDLFCRLGKDDEKPVPFIHRSEVKFLNFTQCFMSHRGFSPVSS